MTDNEIVKALEVCDNSFCEDCKYHDKLFNCRDNLIRDALDLINRLQAENERLTKENTILSQNADTAFQDGLNEAQDLYAEQVKTEIKAEAYKEFAEKVKKNQRKLFNYIYSEDGFGAIVDNLLKELVGDDNG